MVDTTEIRTGQHRSLGRLLLLAAVAVSALVLDQGSKYLVLMSLTPGEPVDVVGSLLRFHLVRNPGAAFSLAAGSTWIFSIAASVVAVAILILARRIRSGAWAVMLGMLLGGTVGNLTDRLFREPAFGLGHVIDFIQVAGFPAIFNVADSFIVVSMSLFVILTMRGVGLDGTRTGAPAKDTSPDADGPAARAGGG